MKVIEGMHLMPVVCDTRSTVAASNVVLMQEATRKK